MSRLTSEPPIDNGYQRSADGQDRSAARISELERQLAATGRSLADLTLLLDATASGSWSWEVSSGEVQVSDCWKALIGYRPDEIAVDSIDAVRMLCHPDDLPDTERRLQALLEGQDNLCVREFRIRHQDENWLWVVDRSIVAERDGAGFPIRVTGVLQADPGKAATSGDNGGSAPCEYRIRCDGGLENLVHNIPGLFYRINGNGAAVLSAVPDSLPAYSREEYARELFGTMSLIHPDDLHIVTESNIGLRTTPHSETISYRIRTRSGESQWLDDVRTSTFTSDGRFCGIDGVLFDITERVAAETDRRKLESHRRKSSRLETIGTLAGGIAHDFNNILTPILGYAEMGAISLTEEDTLHEYFSEIILAAERAQNLVSQMLTFSRAQDSKVTSVSLREIVDEALKLLKPTIPPAIVVTQHIASPDGSVLADPSQIHQVVTNICTNALQAMEKNGGTLSIDIDEVTADPELLRSYPKLQPGTYLRLGISDTGIGMDETVMERIFEPFFTTKSVDKGTGLGLSVVHGIIMNCNGEIAVESTPGKGSSFVVYLPAINRQDTGTTSTGKSCGINGNVLYTDDDTTSVQSMTIMLNKLGFEVQAQNTAAEALRIFHEDPARFNLVLTNLNMAGMTGIELAMEIRKVRPELPIILMTDYGKSIDSAVPMDRYGIGRLLKKPVELPQLAAAVNALLFNNHLQVPS